MSISEDAALRALHVDDTSPCRFSERELSNTGVRVAKYFATSGFSRWTAIYGDGQLPPIWNSIREGHDLALGAIREFIEGDEPGTALDAGCGTGTLAIALARDGYAVDAFDVSAPMVSFARYAAGTVPSVHQPTFRVGDIGAIDIAPKAYRLVCCLDVLFHYPHEEVAAMLTKLAASASHKVIGSFALRTPLNAFWMMIGKRFFHQKNRMTNLHLLSYDDIEQVLYRAGFRMTRTRRIKRFFYDSFVFEAVRR